jgi:hypothetical protein
MQKDQLTSLITGLVLGLLLMFFWQLGARLNNNNMRLAQMEQATIQNQQTIEEIVNFINSATAPDEGNNAVNLEE